MANEMNENIKQEERMYFTLVKRDHKLGGRGLVLGRIMGYKELLCDGERNGRTKPAFPITIDDDGNAIIASICTQELYDVFTAMVELHYSGLCIFDYDYQPVKAN